MADPNTNAANGTEAATFIEAGTLRFQAMAYTAHPAYVAGEYQNGAEASDRHRVRLLIDGTIEVTWFGANYRLDKDDLVRALQSAHLDRLAQEAKR